MEAKSDDSGAEIERKRRRLSPPDDLMNRSLRENLKMPVPIAKAPTETTPLAKNGSPRRTQRPNGQSQQQSRPEDVPISPHDSLSLDDIGGMDSVNRQLEEHLPMPLLRPDIYKRKHLPLPKGILLHGPPGCGKTMIARAWAAELQVPFIEILGPSFVSSLSGDSEKMLREQFEKAKKQAPCLVFIDEIDAIAPKRDSSQSQMEKRIVAQLLVSMDELGKDYEKPVIVLAATNRVDSLDPALRRGGRFGTEITINVPNVEVREQILRALTRETAVGRDVDFGLLAKKTAGFVGADLHDFVGQAASWQMNRYRTALMNQAAVRQSDGTMDVDGEQSSNPGFDVFTFRGYVSRLRDLNMPEPVGFEQDEISMSDFLAVLPGITPSSKREGFTTIPDVSWKDVGALQSVREELQTAIVDRIDHPDRYKKLGAKLSEGVLLWGPPGCGKTLLAKATAAESKANFISVKGPELIDKFVGESEAAVRRTFLRARASIPCVIFFDEIDALAPKRGDDPGGFAARIVGTLLSELDGLGSREGIYVIGATNRPDAIDEALLRPGRLGKSIYVGSPDEIGRLDILRTLLRSRPVDNMEEILQIGRACGGYSGADLGDLIEEATNNAIRRNGDRVSASDFEHARGVVVGSIKDNKRYEALRARFGGNRAR